MKGSVFGALGCAQAPERDRQRALSYGEEKTLEGIGIWPFLEGFPSGMTGLRLPV